MKRFILPLCVILVFLYYVSDFRCNAILQYDRTTIRVRAICKVINDSIENLNYGGCGYFAYELGLRLSKYGIKCNPMVIGRDYNHVLLQINQRCAVDSRGPHALTRLYEKFFWHAFIYAKPIDFSDLVRELNGGDWNPQFDKKQLPKMKRLMDSLVDLNFKNYNLYEH